MRLKFYILFISSLLIMLVFIGCTQTSSVAPVKKAQQAFAEVNDTEKASSGVQGETSNNTPSPTSAPSPSPLPTSTPTPALVAYNGPIRHIFFHPLIIYPERAFDGDFMEKGYNDWFVTVKEFKLIVESLYRNGYVLIDINSIWDIKSENGETTVAKKQLMLPEGKKPMVISIDDLNYYRYMRANGNAIKMVLDSEGNTAVLSVQANGTEVVSRDEIVPILDDFTKLHPDFSFNGAKGVIALTGYEGVLGYRTNEINSPAYGNEKAEALKIISRLKETGWTFASHGYGHLKAGKITEERLMSDTKRWLDEVGSLVGGTPIYIYPYGNRVNEKDSDPKLKGLMDLGFHVFCAVGPDGIIKYKSGFITLDRKSIDGLTLHVKSKYLKDLFDSSLVMDSIRPDNY